MLSIEESRLFILDFFLSVFIFIKTNIFSILTAFFLVKGKFIFVLFFKKILFISATGLSKRYLVEKVFMGNMKTHFFDHLSNDIKRLAQHAKKNFKNFPLVKKVITVFAFLGSLGFVGKFMGGMIAVKVFIAKIWSFLLAIFLKMGTAIIYFFTDYLWGSWIAPIVEVIIFTWLFSWMEKVPFLAKSFSAIYTFFVKILNWVDCYVEKWFHIPVKRFLKFFVKKIQKSIYDFIDYKPVSAWKRLEEIRILNPSPYQKILDKQKGKRIIKKRISIRDTLNRKRKYQ